MKGVSWKVWKRDKDGKTLASFCQSPKFWKPIDYINNDYQKGKLYDKKRNKNNG